MKSNNWLTALIVMLVGILLIVWHQRVDVLNWIVLAVGIMLIVPGLYSCISALVRKSLGAIALGVWMVVSPAFFVGLLAYIFGAILILYGIFHIIVVAVWSRPFILPWWFYLIPVLMIIAGVVILCTDVRTINSAVVLITGIALVASSVNSVLEISATNPARTKNQIEQ